jgi:Rha family phage regulatory protein
MTTQSIQLVQTHGQQAFTTSLIVAEEYGKRHADITRAIRQMLESVDSEISKFSQRNFTPRDYIDARGKAQPMYQITEDGFFELAMSFTGDKARKTRIRFIGAFRKALDYIAENFKDPPRTGLIHEKRASMWDMTDALKEIRAEAGKDTKSFHYATENKLLNWCVRGEFKPLDESSLSNEEVELLRKVRMKDAAYIRADMEYEERKAKLKAYADRLRVIKLIA